MTTSKERRAELVREQEEIETILEGYEYRTMDVGRMKMQFPVSPDGAYHEAKNRRDTINQELRKLDEAESPAVVHRARIEALVGKSKAVKVDGYPGTIISIFKNRADVQYNGKTWSVPIANIVPVNVGGLWGKPI